MGSLWASGSDIPYQCEHWPSQKADSFVPRRASNAGSKLPRLALRTAFITATSIVGKASLRVFSACWIGGRGRGGFGGGTSSSTA